MASAACRASATSLPFAGSERQSSESQQGQTGYRHPRDPVEALDRLGRLLGHLAVAWAARSAAPGLLRRSLTALGRMALSNYLSQSLLLGLVFYGHGLGLIGRLGFLETMAIAPLVWGLQLAISTWWLRHFAQDPMEWLWRSLAQGRRLPMRIPRP